MRLVFQRLTIRKFKHISEQVAIPLSRLPRGLISILGVNQVDPGLGSNGAGKSTLWDALLWCLYGKTVRGLRNTDIAPWSGERGTRVILRFKLGNKRHKLVRKANPNRIILDGRGIMQEALDKLLPFNLDTSLNTWVLGQRQPLFFDLSPKDKLELFSSVLDLDRWEGRAEFASKIASNIRNELLKIEVDIGVAKKELDSNKETTNDVRTQMSRWGEEHRKQINELEASIKVARAGIETADRKKIKADLAYDGAKTELKTVEKGILQLEDYARASLAELNDWKVKKAGWAKEREQVQNDLDTINRDRCPTCRQPLHSKEVSQYKDELLDRSRKLRRKIDAGPPSGVLKQISDLEKQLTNLNADREKLIEKANKAESSVTYWAPELAKLEERRNRLFEQVKKLREEGNPHRALLAALKKDRIKIQDELDEAEDRYRILERRLKRTEFWIKGFKDVRLYVLEECLAQLELATNAQLAAVGMKGWSVQYAVERETNSGTIQRGLTVFIKSPRNKKPVRWESWSGGEGQRLRLVGAWALAETLLAQAGVSVNLEVVDEPTQNLSPEGTRDVVELLADRAKRLNQRIFYVDHTARESGRYADTIYVTRTPGRVRVATQAG